MNTDRIYLQFLLIAAFPSILLAANPAGVGWQAAAESTKRFEVGNGLEATLFAAEPMVLNPTDMDVDARGRVWIVEGANYRSTFKQWGTLRREGDRIMILEDTNGDGRADKETVFYQDPGINAALGVCVLDNRVIVSVSPHVFVLTDTDRDDKADKRELMFTGIQGVDHDHGVHAFVFGPDGKLYFNMGNDSKQLQYPLERNVPLHGAIGKVESRPVVDLAGNEVKVGGKPYRMGLVFRCNLDGSQVETLAWNFRNNYEVAVDSFGTLWQSDNDDDGNKGVRINYVMEFGNFGYQDEMTGAGWVAGWDAAKQKGAAEDLKVFHEWHQFDPGVVPNLLNTGAGSPTGIAVYEGNLLPAVFRNQMIHCDAGPRVVRAYPCEPMGAGYSAGTVDILQSTNTWFRPADVCVAPDGSLYVADWNDAGVGGHNMADQKLETMTGRVYRVAPPGNKPSPPKLDLKTSRGCVAALQSPNMATRYLAWMRLKEMGDNAEKDLVRLWKSKDPRMRARAVQLLARISGREKTHIAEAIKDPDADIRITGLRIARALKTEILPCVETLVNDGSPQVRRECAIALRHNPAADAPRLWAQLASQHDGKDRWYLEALGIGADGQWDRFMDAWLDRTKQNWNTPAGRDIIWRSRGSKTAGLAAKIIADPATNPAERDRFFRSLDFVTADQKESTLIELVGSENRQGPEIALAALSRLKSADPGTNPRLQSALTRLLEQVRGRPEFLELVRQFKVKGQEQGLLEIATKNPESSAGAEAARMLLANPMGVDLLKRELTSSNALSTVKALGSTEKNETVPLLAPLVTDATREPVLRKQAVKALANAHQGATLLLALAKEEKLPDDVRFTASSELNTARWEEVKREAGLLLPLPQSRNAQSLPPLPELLKMKGDATKGAVVYRSETAACVKCHQLQGEGIDFGPSLAEIGTKLGKDALYESILDPSAGISFGYEPFQLALKNGEEAYGIIVSETPEEISVKGVNGIVTRHKKTEIESRIQQKISAMPAGLQQVMTPQELVDLVEYLATLKSSAGAPAKN